MWALFVSFFFFFLFLSFFSLEINLLLDRVTLSALCFLPSPACWAGAAPVKELRVPRCSTNHQRILRGAGSWDTSPPVQRPPQAEGQHPSPGNQVKVCNGDVLLPPQWAVRES